MYCKKSEKYNTSLSFWRFENRLFLLISILCIIGWYRICSTESSNPDAITVSLIATILSLTLIPLGQNFGKYRDEKKQIKSICESIVDLSLFLINDLNTYLIKTNNPIVTSLDEIHVKEMEHFDFGNFKVFDDLFSLIATELCQFMQMEYLTVDKTFEFVVKKVTSSIEKAVNEKNYNKLYQDLFIILKVVGTVDPLQEKNYTEMFNEKITEANKILRNTFYNYTDEYAVECLENDLSERANSYNK